MYNLVVSQFFVLYWMLCNAGSPSISGAAIMKVLVAVYIQFMSFLVVVTPSQLLWSHASHIMLSFLVCCCHCSASFDSYSYFVVSACPLFWAFAAPYIPWLLVMHVGIACLHLSYWGGLLTLPCMLGYCVWLSWPVIGCSQLVLIGVYPL